MTPAFFLPFVVARNGSCRTDFCQLAHGPLNGRLAGVFYICAATPALRLATMPASDWCGCCSSMNGVFAWVLHGQRDYRSTFWLPLMLLRTGTFAFTAVFMGRYAADRQPASFAAGFPEATDRDAGSAFCSACGRPVRLTQAPDRAADSRHVRAWCAVIGIPGRVDCFSCTDNLAVYRGFASRIPAAAMPAIIVLRTSTAPNFAMLLFPGIFGPLVLFLRPDRPLGSIAIPITWFSARHARGDCRSCRAELACMGRRQRSFCAGDAPDAAPCAGPLRMAAMPGFTLARTLRNCTGASLAVWADPVLRQAGQYRIFTCCLVCVYARCRFEWQAYTLQDWREFGLPDARSSSFLKEKTMERLLMCVAPAGQVMTRHGSRQPDVAALWVDGARSTKSFLLVSLAAQQLLALMRARGFARMAHLALSCLAIDRSIARAFWYHVLRTGGRHACATARRSPAPFRAPLQENATVWARSVVAGSAGSRQLFRRILRVRGGNRA